jgi:hypothetical protein
VVVVVTGAERQALTDFLERVEQETGKGRAKWTVAKDSFRLAYIRRVLSSGMFSGKLYYGIHRNTRDYAARTVMTAARAITHHAGSNYLATVFVDGLSQSLVHWFGTSLRRLFVRTRKVRGIRREESDALMRLSDAVCGFVRSAVTGREELKSLLEEGKRKGVLQEL